MGRYILHKGEAKLSDLADGSAIYGVPGGHYQGRQYFVNNITGASGNTGEDWDNAMDQPSTAITAATAYLATLPTNNQNVRNQIFIHFFFKQTIRQLV